jgi:prolyl oligopeptidase PreP (S9A serine peptidase family)
MVQIDLLLESLRNEKQRESILLTTTGETLGHLRNLDLIKILNDSRKDLEFSAKKLQSPNEIKKIVNEMENEEEEEEEEEVEKEKSIVEILIHLLDRRHQILSAQYHLERSSNALVTLSEKRLIKNEEKIMQFESDQQKEVGIVNQVAESIRSLMEDYDHAQFQTALNQIQLDSIIHQRKKIRTSNLKNNFVPAYRQSIKALATTSDQLVLTILL